MAAGSEPNAPARHTAKVNSTPCTPAMGACIKGNGNVDKMVDMITLL